MESSSKVVCYRTGMASLLAKLAEDVSETEQWLDVDVEADDTSARVVLEDHPTAVFRVMCALLLRKANLHMIAMLRANDDNNVHSLAVQMRPVLECAGQVVLVFHNLMVEPERGASIFRGYINSDYYRTVSRLTRGDVSQEQLLTQISEASGMSEGAIRKGRSLKQADKVALLEGGNDWYGYLSDRFCHGKADWRGYSWHGGVISIDTVQDHYTFAGLVDYLVNQAAVMNAYASLCPMEGEIEHGRVESALVQLQNMRAMTKALRDSAAGAFGYRDASLNESGHDGPKNG